MLLSENMEKNKNNVEMMEPMMKNIFEFIGLLTIDVHTHTPSFIRCFRRVSLCGIWPSDSFLSKWEGGAFYFSRQRPPFFNQRRQWSSFFPNLGRTFNAQAAARSQETT